jgi:8-amino-7-oxononanoate synthase
MPLRWIDDALAQLDAEGLLRPRRGPLRGPGSHVELGGRRLLNLCSNDYLSLAARPPAVAPAGAGASRLVGGHQLPHEELERALAAWLGIPSTLLFTSGYAANVGAISALATGRDALLVSDEHNHASIVDGCRLSRARVVVTPHRDVEAVERALRGASEREKLVLTDGYFSMDGDVPDLAALRRVCDRYDAALYVDEAHALGVIGPEGRGATAAAGVGADIVIGTLGKAFGVGGAFVGGTTSLQRWLWNRSRAFVFSTGLPGVIAATALDRLPEVRDGVRTARLQRNSALFRAALVAAGVPVLGGSVGPIVPVVLGDPRRAVRAADALVERGYFVHPMRPPTVPRGTSRLRLTVQADHAPEELLAAAAAIAEVLA